MQASSHEPFSAYGVSNCCCLSAYLHEGVGMRLSIDVLRLRCRGPSPSITSREQRYADQEYYLPPSTKQDREWRVFKHDGGCSRDWSSYMQTAASQSSLASADATSGCVCPLKDRLSRMLISKLAPLLQGGFPISSYLTLSPRRTCRKLVTSSRLD